MPQTILNDGSPHAVGSRFQRLRMMAGLEQYELAKEASVSKTSISYWETGRSLIKPRNVAKVIKAIRAHGVECDEHWLLTGIGITPRLTFLFKEGEAPYSIDTPAQQIAALECEVKLFLTYRPQAVMVIIENDRLSPCLRKGDYVAGEWKVAQEFTESDFCIIQHQDKLTVRYVVPAENTSLFYLYNTPVKEPNSVEPQALDKVAPLIRLWR